MERRVVDAVPVDLPDVEVVPDLGDVVRLDAVRDAPYPAVARRGVRIRQGRPEGPLDERDDAAGRRRRAPVVLAA